MEQKEYENAMLRILGWNKKYIVIVTILKSVLFTIIPGATLGLVIAEKITALLKQVIYQYALIKLDLSFTSDAILVGLACALLLPMVSMIQPLQMATSIELRDALDTYRRKSNDVSVQFTRLQDMYGLSMF